MQDTTYDVRIYKTEVRKGVKVNTYTVRWKTDRKSWKEAFRNKAQAESFIAELRSAVNRGEAFSVRTGRPASWSRRENAMTWYTFSLEYAAAKWPFASPNHRRGIAEALTDATEALLTTASGGPSRSELRAALRGWAYSGRLQKGDTEPPEDLTHALRWLERNTIDMAALDPEAKGPELARAVVDRLSVKQNGKPAASSTAIRKRVTFNNALEYACERRILSGNPLQRVKLHRPRTAKTLDMRVVVNPEQASRLLDAVRRQGKRGPRMVAFYAVMYYAALRPEEAVDLRPEHLVSLPDEGWGEMELTHAEPRSGSRWTNSGKARDRQPLKHRAEGETRPVPIHPDLVRILREHIETFEIKPGQRLFTGPRGGIMTDRTYLGVWHDARAEALTAAESASPLAQRPYDLRHAALSTWLAAGVPPAQVSLWGGNSIGVLLQIYAKVIAGLAEAAKHRISEAMETDKRTLASDAGTPPEPSPEQPEGGEGKAA
ncbi:tyrosine-type recombinase/integrase [Actinomadura sp. NEAU-AAG7]|uniref:tyrosine-type recombinase/integrase n=1 Tax=Actinomadura sp. NEAU-AAG7 TaxID=2839640 RepID=UPI001BE412C4|nr:tyrosine-type recombinase/integrase [Actinomadura sp. NEAU-AAG7]MBT2210314.1 tyrosine-type recombinase/integrase [Actinomadura sp. NEAU-AAG7]